MLRAALKGVVANKLRLVLTALAIVIGVAFVAASFIFTDTINARFETLITDISAGVDVYVRPNPPETGNELVEFGSIPDATLAQVQAVPGVRVAEGAVAGYAQFVGADGDPVGGLGPPTLGFSWTTTIDLNPMTIAPENGRAPTGPAEVVSDLGTAETAGFGLGDTVTILTLGPPEQFEVVGLNRKHWSTTTPIRKIFRNAFEDAGLPYFNPHSFRDTLSTLGQTICPNPEAFKAWSRNLGHEKVLTTFFSYGEMSLQRQGEIIRGLANPQPTVTSDVHELARAVVHEMRQSELKL